MAVAKMKFGAQIDPTLHQKLKQVSSITGRKIDAIVEDALRQGLAAYPTDGFCTFEEMHARYEKLHGVHIDVAAEAATLSRSRRRAKSR